MKKIAAILSIFLLLPLLGGCVYVGFRPNVSYVSRQGQFVSRSIDVSEIRSLTVGCEATLELMPGDKPEAIITTYENFFDSLTIRTDGDTLDINSRAIFDDKINIKITAPELEELTIAGGVTLICDEPLALDTLDMDVAGLCEGTLNLRVNEFTLLSAGASKLELLGSAQSCSVTSAGASTINGSGFSVKSASIVITGAGNATLRCEDELTVSISGAGTVNYYGNPRVSQSIAGVGTIRKAGD